MGLAGDWLTPFDNGAGTARIFVVEDQVSGFELIEEALQGDDPRDRPGARLAAAS